MKMSNTKRRIILLASIIFILCFQNCKPRINQITSIEDKTNLEKPVIENFAERIQGVDLISFQSFDIRVKDKYRSPITESKSLIFYRFKDSVCIKEFIGFKFKTIRRDTFKYFLKNDSIYTEYGWQIIDEDEIGNIYLSSIPKSFFFTTTVFSNVQKFDLDVNPELIKKYLLDETITFNIKSTEGVSLTYRIIFNENGFCDVFINSDKRGSWFIDEWKIESEIQPGEFFILLTGSVKPIQIAKMDLLNITGYSYNYRNEYFELIKDTSEYNFNEIKGDWKVKQETWSKIKSITVKSKNIILIYNDGKVENYSTEISKSNELFYMHKNGAIDSRLRIIKQAKSELKCQLRNGDWSRGSEGTVLNLYR